MSRKIDSSDLDALSNEDLVYLHARGRVGDHVLEARGISLADYTIGSLPLEERANTGTANTRGLTKEQFERETAALADDDDDDDEDDTPLEELTNDQLRVRLTRLNLSVMGRKDELIARLREALEGDDDSSEENTEED